jgi:HD-like signal output (HDOD) protein
MALLWSRVRQRGDLPGFSKVVGAILAAMRGENEREFNMTKTVLSDPALTQKVLRLANSPMYAVFGSGINTVSKAVMVLGSEVIGHLALGLKLIDELTFTSPDTRNAQDEMEKAVLAGHVARQLVACVSTADAEEAVVCAMLHSLGRMMVSFYLPEQWGEVQSACADNRRSEDAAAQDVFGLSLTEIGRLTAERWGLPASIVDTLEDVPPSHFVSEPLNHARWLAAVSSVSSRCAKVLHEDAPSVDVEIFRLADGYADMLGLEAPQMLTAVHRAERVAEEEIAFVRPSVLASREGPKQIVGKPEDSMQLLAAGVADLRGAAMNANASQRMTIALETVYKGLGLSRAMVFSRNVEETRYAARMHFGCLNPELMVRLVLGDAYEPDVFHAALANDKMIFVQNPHAPGFATKLPAWWMENLRSAQSFIVLPLMVNHHAVGFIYGDWDETAPKISITPAEIGLLDELRMRAVQGIADWRRLEEVLSE